MSQDVLRSPPLTLSQYVTLAYKSWSLKVTINDLRTSVSILEESTEANSSKQEKGVLTSSPKTAKGKKGKDPMEGSNARE